MLKKYIGIATIDNIEVRTFEVSATTKEEALAHAEYKIPQMLKDEVWTNLDIEIIGKGR